MELPRFSPRLKLLLFFFLLFFLSFPLKSKEKFNSSWIIILEGNFSSSFSSAILKELKNLPNRLTPQWEREEMNEKHYNSEREKLKTEYSQKKSYQDFDYFDPISAQERQQASYKFIYLKEENNKKKNNNFWVPLSFSFKKEINLKEDPFLSGYIFIKKIENLSPDTVLFEISLKDKTGKEEEIELFFPKEIDNTQIAKKIRETVASFLLNYSWVNILPEITTKNTSLFINSKKISIKDPILLFWPKEMLPLKISLEKKGYQSWQEEIQENNLYLLKEPIELTSKKEEKGISIKTTPPEADVYLDNLWVGITPFELKLEGEEDFLTLKKEGYNPLTVSVYTLESKSSFNLNLSLEDQKAYNLKKRKTLFYASLSTLIFSLVPTAGFASWDLENQRLQEMGYPQKRSLSQSLLWTSVGLNIGALIWNIVESVLYVKEVEKNLKY